MIAIPILFSALLTTAHAEVAPECEGLLAPDDYDEQVQQDFLQNFPALSSSLSALHAPIPHDAGHGSLGLEVAVIPPLGCDRRSVLQYTKTEDTNKSPVLPRPRLTFAFKPIADRIYPYAGLAFVPPVPVGGTWNTIVSTEFGAGMQLSKSLQAGLRFHGTLHRTVGDIATAFHEEDGAYLDYYNASTMGFDVSAGWTLDTITPYLSVGLLDVSSYFWIGDDGHQAAFSNLHPYFGPALSLGVDMLLAEKFRAAGEFFSAPGGYSTPDPDVESVEQSSRYGKLNTVRFKIAYEL